MATTNTSAQIPVEDESHDDDLDYAIRDYVRTYALWHGRVKAAETFGVSRHTSWRCLERGRLGKSLPRAVVKAVGDDPNAIKAATWAMIASRQIQRRAAANPKPLAETLEDALRLLCAAPLTTADELSAFGRVPVTTLRRRLAKLAQRGLADSVSYWLSALGPNPNRRHFPTERGIEAAAGVEHGTERFLSEYPVSREWFRLLAERLDAAAALYHLAAVIANADPQQQPVRVDHYRQGPYDLLITLSGGRSLGIVRQGPMLSSANLRYRMRTLEQLRQRQRPTATLVLTHARPPAGPSAPWETPANTAVPSSPPRGNCWRETPKPRCGSSAARAAAPSCPRRPTPTCPWTTSWAGWESAWRTPPLTAAS